jgi:FimV-like protein
LGSAYGFLEKREEALAILDKLFEMKEKQYVAALNIARIYIGLGDSDAAFEWLEKAIEERNGEMVFLNVEIRVAKQAASAKKFCDDPRLPDLLHRIGMTQ